MIKIKSDNSYAYFDQAIKNLPATILKEIRGRTSYVIEIYGKPPFRKHLFLKSGNHYRLPTGLLDDVLGLFDKYKIKYDLDKPKFKNKARKSLKDFKQLIKIQNFKLRKYQSRAIRKALKCKWGIINHATGSGKTLTASGIIYCINKKTLYLIHRIGIAKQSAKEINGFTGLPVGLYADNSKELNKQVTSVTSQSLAAFKKRDYQKYIKFLESIEVLICDEVHG